jgi:four helix bundle protein
LAVVQKAHALVLCAYRLTQGFPTSERYGLSAQTRTAALSVPANIVEGHARHGASDRKRFYNMAMASLHEFRYLLALAEDLGYGHTSEWSELHCRADEVRKMLAALAQRTGDHPALREARDPVPPPRR